MGNGRIEPGGTAKADVTISCRQVFPFVTGKARSRHKQAGSPETRASNDLSDPK